MSLNTVAERESVTRSTLARRGLTALVATLVVNALLRTVGTVLDPAAADLEPFAWPAVVVTSVLVVVLATGVYLAFDRFVARPDRLFTGLAAVVLLASMGPVVLVAGEMTGVTTTLLVVLGAMHVASATIIVAALTGRLPTF